MLDVDRIRARCKRSGSKDIDPHRDRRWCRDRRPRRVGNGGTIGFIGSLSGPGVECTPGHPDYNCAGVWTGSPAYPVLGIRSGDVAPGAGGALLGQFTANNYAFFMNPYGTVAFSAQLQGDGVVVGVNDMGIWAGPPGAEWLVARRGDTPPGMPGGTFGVADAPSLNALGKVTFKAELNYMRLVKPVAELLKVPEDETEVVLINDAATWIEIYD